MLSFCPARVTRALVAAAILLTLASLAFQACRIFTGHDSLLGLVHMFDVNEERNLPAWFSSTILLLCGFLLGTIARIRSGQRHPYARHWRSMAVIFCALSIDEIVCMHEMTMRPLKGALNAGSFLMYAWVIPGSAFAALFALANVKFLLHLPRRTRGLFVASGAIYVAGALGLEMVGAYYDSFGKVTDWPYVVICTLEEMCEMAGVILFIHTLMTYLRDQIGEVDVRESVEAAPARRRARARPVVNVPQESQPILAREAS